jgi:hypothetical protein
MSLQKNSEAPLIKGVRLFRSQAVNSLSAAQDLDRPLRLSRLAGPLTVISLILLLLCPIIWIA